ncbi:magnesium chelatase domain-containing protein [Halomonas sp. YLB-10]|uniref:magnesium chelatase domain-containing protein n=1 Tax=Halomonas sp. YLB-10 TaxID=2483111 RepID=UPI00267ECF59
MVAQVSVRGSRERVRSALATCGLDYPLRLIALNLAPVDLPKEGRCFDLPIAPGLLVASAQLAGALDVAERTWPTWPGANVRAVMT